MAPKFCVIISIKHAYQALEYTQSEDNSHNEIYHEVAQKPSIHQQYEYYA